MQNISFLTCDLFLQECVCFAFDLKSSYHSLQMRKKWLHRFYEVSTVAQESQIANLQNEWVIVFVSHDACFCMLMSYRVMITILELIKCIEGPFMIICLMTWSTYSIIEAVRKKMNLNLSKHLDPTANL